MSRKCEVCNVEMISLQFDPVSGVNWFPSQCRECEADYRAVEDMIRQAEIDHQVVENMISYAECERWLGKGGLTHDPECVREPEI